jgi:K+-transporting ATPase ATPase C chain
VNGHVRANLWLLGLTLLVCCVLYPLVVWAVGQAAFRSQAEGSLIYGADGKTVIGSRLIGQPFTSKGYFQPRPSATSPAYNAAASGASNYGASNPKLRARVAEQLEQWRQAYPEAKLEKVPADMVLASGSGLDPHITYENAMYQAPFVAEERAKAFPEARRSEEARKLRKEIEGLIGRLAAPPITGLPIAGEEKIVNVLELNLALDQMRP